MVYQGTVPWDDADLSEGRETSDPESPGSDPDFQPTGRAGAARPGHRRQETAPAPQHYPPDIQDARSPLGPNATRPPQVRASPTAMEDRGGQDPRCNICGDPEHDQDTCPHHPDRLQCKRCHNLGHTALDCQVPSPGKSPAHDRQPLSELSNPVPVAPGDMLQQQGAVGGGGEPHKVWATHPPSTPPHPGVRLHVSG